MAYRFSLDDVAFLRSAAGTDALGLAAGLALTDATRLRDADRLRRAVGARAAAVLETARLRRLAVAKLGPLSADWLLTDEALQQATPAPVAAHRAARLAGIGVHDLTCSIGTELVTLAAGCPVVLGSDLDPVRLAMAAHNLAHSGTPPGVPVVLARADARTPVGRGLLRYADPARRSGTGRRITSADTVPSVAELDAGSADRPPVLRVPPGIDHDALARPGEVELVSLDGTVREAVLWPAELAGPARRATVLTTRLDGTATVLGIGLGIEQVSSTEPDDAPVTPVQDWIVDPDGAVVRAHLVRQWAARHGLSRLDEHLAYLTGPRPPAGVRAFRVLDTAPFTERTVAQWCRRDDIGTLEIKQRGTAVVPDVLRTRLRPALRGPTIHAATLVVARVGRSAQAYWTRAVDLR
ncbi:THUMP-like domain-containing protein [Nakamurella leprariae]|uniref:Class I SAM-dependent methyltransferase n=1 Tax=Nakamurella leprariae TaxID=2803911 RepID=A0A939BVT2_9ACTN|nr:class I SAM-dependent methyltransferase [Nakamurella leprariae]MBM9466838.1 class I SAM-dependent methyltransferase [Nakamurella leprariae]